MSKLYRKYVRDQEVYWSKPAEDFLAAPQGENQEDVSRETQCQKCINIQDLSLWCDECLKRELDTQEAYYSNMEF